MNIAAMISTSDDFKPSYPGGRVEVSLSALDDGRYCIQVAGTREFNLRREFGADALPEALNVYRLLCTNPKIKIADLEHDRFKVYNERLTHKYAARQSKWSD